MFTIYWYFSPIGGSTEAVAAASSSDTLSAPIFKPVPSRPIVQRLAQSPAPIRVGLISGHKGNDSGAVCEDGLTEAQVNEDVAERVAAELRGRGIATDILEEFDPRLGTYYATAVISIHADSCDYVNDLTTGYKISGSHLTDSTALTICVEQAYRAATQLPYHENTITHDMTDYHAFRELPPHVPALIIELGFMNLDRELLTTHANLPTQGIVNGILCFLGRT
jgi:N-acetylmuramoyl-L-alanine amidase